MHVRLRLRRGRYAVLLVVALVAALAGTAPAVARSARPRAQAAAAIDRQNLRLAAFEVQAHALASGALRHAVPSHKPAVVLFRSVQVTLQKARAADPSSRPTDMRWLMGRVPFNLEHRIGRRPGHVAIWATHTLDPFRHAVAVGASAGIGMGTTFRDSRPAPFQRSDGVYVDPTVPMPVHPTVAAIAIRAALKKLGHPYVWAAAGPSTFDCSGLVRWAYGHAGLSLTHFTGSQWNQGRLIRPRSALPGDLILVGHTLHHVGIYLGAGWMLNAPFTGHYVDVVPVPRRVAGVVRP